MTGRFLTLLYIFALSMPLYSWETAIAGVLTTPPAQGLDNRIYSTADDRALHCLDGETGKEYWNFRTGRRLSGFTAVSPDHSILILTVQNTLISVSPGGHELWRFPLETQPFLPPAFDPFGNIYLMSSPDTLLSIDRRGNKTWTYRLNHQVNELFALYDKIMILGDSQTEILNTDGSPDTVIDSVPSRLFYISPSLFWESKNGSIYILDLKKLSLTPAENPLVKGTLHPEPEVLISYQNKIISGRKDWFMEAMEEGEDAYHPYYQWGNNPGRTRGINELPGAALRILRYSERSGAPLLPLLQIDPHFLEQILRQFENAESFQSLLKIDPDYDLLFQKILSDSHIQSFDVNRQRLDEYSRYRIYRILSRWGNMNSRETLLFLSEAEKNPQNLALILEGLGRIGLDNDHRSMTAVLKTANSFPRDEGLISAAVSNAALLAKYNGGRSVLDMMKFYTSLQQKESGPGILKLIQKELNSF